MVHYLDAITIFESMKVLNNLKLAASYSNLGGIIQLEGDVAKAKTYYEKALSIFESALPATDKNIQDLRLQLRLIDIGMTMPELLEKMEVGEDLPAEIIEVLNQSFMN